jgi:glycosyltransferase involved in cell wall biosynthesis
MSERPLVSFIVIAYKQERFIRNTVRGALAQTYQPLEIILSDDGSPDQTFDIIREETQAYRGPHRVVLNRNEPNRGLAGNVNRAWELSRGEMVVLQGGDDISAPERTEMLVRAWQEPNPVDCVFSDFGVIDASGRILLPSQLGPHGPAYAADLAGFVRFRRAWVSGCTAAYSADLNRRYGPLPSHLLCEDAVLAFRALLGRGVRYVSVPLVQHRVHDANVYSGKGLESGQASAPERMRWNANSVCVAREWMRCFEMSGQTHEGCRRALAEIERRRRYEERAFKASRWQVPGLALRALAGGLSLRHTLGLLKRNFLRL